MSALLAEAWARFVADLPLYLPAQAALIGLAVTVTVVVFRDRAEDRKRAAVQDEVDAEVVRLLPRQRAGEPAVEVPAQRRGEQ